MALQQFDSYPGTMFRFSPVAYPRSVAPRTATQKSRQRGVVLTEHGWKKLLARNVLQNRDGEWYTYELLGDRTLLSPRTVSKIVGCEIGVDRRSLRQFFAAFNLPLENIDYSLVGCGARNPSNTSHRTVALVFQLYS